MRLAELHAKAAELATQGQTFAIATVIGVHGSSPRGIGAKMIVLEDGTRLGTIGGDCLESDTAEECVKLIAQEKAAQGVAREPPTKILSMLLDEQEQGGVGMLCGGKVDVLVEVVRPELQIVVCGSGPVAMSVVRMADFVEVPSTLIDPIAPREALPRSSTFINEWHEVGLGKVPITPQTAIVLVTRHKNDVPSMRAALATPAGYIGMIGSKYRVQTILNRLAKELSVPLGELDSARVHAPIGLDIGAETPQEIALSIVSEILAHFRKATAQPKALERAAVAVSRKRSAPSAA